MWSAIRIRNPGRPLPARARHTPPPAPRRPRRSAPSPQRRIPRQTWAEDAPFPALGPPTTVRSPRDSIRGLDAAPGAVEWHSKPGHGGLHGPVFTTRGALAKRPLVFGRLTLQFPQSKGEFRPPKRRDRGGSAGGNHGEWRRTALPCASPFPCSPRAANLPPPGVHSRWRAGPSVTGAPRPASRRCPCHVSGGLPAAAPSRYTR